MLVEFLPEDKQPTACIKCGKCSEICPQKIDIPTTLENLVKLVDGVPSWKSVCIERDAEQKLNSGK